MTLHGAKDSDFKPVPYTRLAQCERKPRGEIDCPDIRRKGTTRLRQAQLVLTRMLRVFDIIAKKHGIRYWLYRGTLLGAVRHNGHIPFDNDVDICIPKPDFEKFVKYGTKELPDDIFFQTEETDRHWKKFRLGPACLENYVTHEVATSPAAAVGITMVYKWICLLLRVTLAAILLRSTVIQIGFFGDLFLVQLYEKRAKFCH